MERVANSEPNLSGSLGRQILTLSSPLENAEGLDPLLERIGDARYVLLGEASHGTHEYYLWRARISRLIEEKGFRFIAVEGAGDCYRVNRYIQGELGDTTAEEALRGYNRWPTWMWANWRSSLLRSGCAGTTSAAWRTSGSASTDSTSTRCGNRSTRSSAISSSIIRTPSRLPTGPSSASSPTPRTRRNTPAPPSSFQTPAARRYWICCAVRERAVADVAGNATSLDAVMNAEAVKNAAAYYRTMVGGGAESWNLRDRHMADTLNRLMQHYGSDAKAIVWEHNTHIGDARYEHGERRDVQRWPAGAAGAWRRWSSAGWLRLLRRDRGGGAELGRTNGGDGGTTGSRR